MAIKAGVGISRHHNPNVAGREAVEQALAKAGVDPEVPWVGFYTFGEIGPVAGHNLRHIYTAVVVALS